MSEYKEKWIWDITPKGRLNDGLLIAIDNHKDEEVKFLLDKGANPNSCYFPVSDDDYGISALHLAFMKQKSEEEIQYNIIKMLVEYGADINRPYRNEHDICSSPLDIARGGVSSKGWGLKRQDIAKKTVELFESLGAKKVVYRTTMTLE